MSMQTPLDSAVSPTDGVARLQMAMAHIEALSQDLHEALERNAQERRLAAQQQRTMVLQLSKAAELRDDDTGAHIVRLGYLAELLARRLEMPDSFCVQLRLAAPMHDIGKLGIPDSILKKPGALTAEERLVMNQHTTMGAEILKCQRTRLFDMAADIAQYHHEKFDGCGYPHNKAGSDIPISARIVTVVDFFDALTMDRCYRAALPVSTAVDMMLEQSGRHFDPDIVRAFERSLGSMVDLKERINAANMSIQDMLALHEEDLMVL